MISCLHKYWLKQFVKFFLIIQLIILVLFIFIDYLSRLDKFLGSDITLAGGLWYVMLKVPFMFVQLTPASTLLASITVFALMNRSNELLAVRSSGISVYFLIRPGIAVAIGLALLMFFLGETIIPVSMAKANYIKFHVLKKKQNYFGARKDIWIKSENKLVHINFYDPIKNTIAGITVTSLGKGFSLTSRIDARTGEFVKGRWIFKNVVEQIHTKDTTDYDVIIHEKMEYPLEFKPEDLQEISKKSEEMSFFELKNYIQKVENEGYDATAYHVDLYGKIAFPFICIVMVLTGAATGMRRFVKENLPVAIAIGVVVTFLYWIMYGFCLSLGYGKILPPLISAWASNLFFICAGVLYLVNAE